MDMNEIAASLGIHEYSLYRWMKDGVPHKKATKINFDLEAVTEWAAKNGKLRGGRPKNESAA